LFNKELKALLRIDQFSYPSFLLLLVKALKVFIALKLIFLLAFIFFGIVVLRDIILLPSHIPEHFGGDFLAKGLQGVFLDILIEVVPGESATEGVDRRLLDLPLIEDLGVIVHKFFPCEVTPGDSTVVRLVVRVLNMEFCMNGLVHTSAMGVVQVICHGDH